MKDEYVWEERGEDEAPVREKIVIGRMKWDFERMEGVPIKDDGGSRSLMDFSEGEYLTAWEEDNERKRSCGYWGHVPKSKFKEGAEDNVCAMCEAKKVK